MIQSLTFRFFAIILALMQPIIIIFFKGINVLSLSSMWGTELEPLFIFTNAITSFYLIQDEKWQVPSLFLMLLTVFSMNVYPFLHNLFAAGFFISSLVALFEKEKYKIFPIIYLISIVFLPKKHYFWMEIWAIYVICAYHLNILWIIYKFKQRDNDENQI